jgi:mRNA interferase MazF
VLLDYGDDDLIIAPVTSHTRRVAFDVPLGEWQQAGLALPSIARVHKPFTIEKALVERKLGALASDDWESVKSKVQELWAQI